MALIMRVDFRPPNCSLDLKMQIVNVIMNKFPKEQSWKEHPSENDTKVQEGWENFAQAKWIFSMWRNQAKMA